MSTEPILNPEAFFKRHQDNPKLYRIIYSFAAFFWVYGFILFNVAGYHRATELKGYYAEIGLFVLGMLFMFSGAILYTIKYRKNDSRFRSPAHAVTFHLGIAALPLLVALSFSWAPIAFLWREDSYMELTVKATEPVKKDLKWLLGDLYPEDQEKNIDPETLEWTMVLAEMPLLNHEYVLYINSSKATQRKFEWYKSTQFNKQELEAVWFDSGQEKRETLAIDWEKAEFFGYNEKENRKSSYPVCDLRAPLEKKLPEGLDNVKVLLNGQNPDERLVNHYALGFRQPSSLPSHMRIEGDELVVRTNYNGGAWTVYCFYNFPRNNRSYIPEPVTSGTMSSLNGSDFKLHFILFPGIHLTGSILAYKEHFFTRRTTYEEYFDKLDRFVALSVLNTTRSGIVSGESY